MGHLFGVDGIRDIALSGLTCERALQVGKALTFTLINEGETEPKILIAKDTRSTCDIYESALIAGICSAGGSVVSLGVLPSAAVAFLTVKYGASAGISITASQSTFEYNGLTIYSKYGYRISEQTELEIEDLVLNHGEEIQLAEPQKVGTVSFEKNAEWDYVRYLLKNIDTSVNRLKIVVDAVNGASFTVAEKFFKGLGANVLMYGVNPDGTNINSTSLEDLAKAVTVFRAHAGVYLNGDGTSCVLVDEKGNIINGDAITAILALAMKNEEKLNANTCVVNHVTNLGFFRWAKENGIVVSTAPKIGNRYVSDRMLSDGYNLGGDQSGYVVLSDASYIADGCLTAAKVFEVMVKSNKRLSELAEVFTPYPQLVVNVELRPESRDKWSQVPEVNEMIAYCQRRLDGDGRILVRESGTEPLIQVMVEGRDEEAIYQYAHAIAKVVKEFLGVSEE